MVSLFGKKYNLALEDDGISFDQHQIKFKIKKYGSSKFNEAHIEIYNASNDSKAKLERTQRTIILEAGHRDEFGTIFVGQTIAPTSTEKSGHDFITKITAKDGAEKIKDSVISITFKAGMTEEQMIRAIIKEMNLKEGLIKLDKNLFTLATIAPFFTQGLTNVSQFNYPNGIIFKDLDKTTISKARSFSEPARTLLKRLVENNGLKWSIIDEKMYIVPVGSSFSQKTDVLSPDSGLIGSPEMTANGGIICKSLLRPHFNPGLTVTVQTDTVFGNYVIQDCEHSGDYEGNEWETEFEGIKQG